MIPLQFLYRPLFWHFDWDPQKWPILTPKKGNMRSKQKIFPRIHIDTHLVKFGLCDPIYVLHLPIGGSHPPCTLSRHPKNTRERHGTAMYFSLPGTLQKISHFCSFWSESQVSWLKIPHFFVCWAQMPREGSWGGNFSKELNISPLVSDAGPATPLPSTFRLLSITLIKCRKGLKSLFVSF